MATLDENPMLHFIAYGLRNEWVMLALKEGAYDAWCPTCHGLGHVHSRPCRGCGAATDNVNPKVRACTCSPIRCRRCRHRCQTCKGSKLREDQQLNRADFGDDESLDTALRFIAGALDAAQHNGFDRPALR